jgi:hypothetical protein
MIMTAIKPHLSAAELEHRYKAASEPIGKSHFHALWLLSQGYDIDETAEILSFSPRWLATYHGLKSVHDQRGWDALIAIGYSIQQPRPRHPQAASEKDRTRLKKSFKPPSPPSAASIRTPRSRSGRRTSIASA